jgi:hypothetical protein
MQEEFKFVLHKKTSNDGAGCEMKFCSMSHHLAASGFFPPIAHRSDSLRVRIKPIFRAHGSWLDRARYPAVMASLQIFIFFPQGFQRGCQALVRITVRLCFPILFHLGFMFTTSSMALEKVIKDTRSMIAAMGSLPGLCSFVD